MVVVLTKFFYPFMMEKSGGVRWRQGQKRYKTAAWCKKLKTAALDKTNMSYTATIIAAINSLRFPFGLPGIIEAYALCDYDKLDYFMREKIVIHGDGNWVCNTICICKHRFGVSISSDLTPSPCSFLWGDSIIAMLNARQIKVSLEGDSIPNSERTIQIERMLKKVVDLWLSF